MASAPAKLQPAGCGPPLIVVASGGALHGLTGSNRLREATALRIAGLGMALVAAFAILNATLLG